MPMKPLISRRQFVAGSALIAGGAALSTAGPALAQNKTSQAEAEYQATPKGEEKCANCTFFESAAKTCKVVDGTVAAEGWCALYSTA